MRYPIHFCCYDNGRLRRPGSIDMDNLCVAERRIGGVAQASATKQRQKTCHPASYARNQCDTISYPSTDIFLSYFILFIFGARLGERRFVYLILRVACHRYSVIEYL